MAGRLAAAGADVVVSSRTASDVERVAAARDDVEAAVEGVTVAFGDWMPQFEASGSYGYEKQDKETSADTSVPPREVDFSINQLVWDFGKIDADIGRARSEES